MYLVQYTPLSFPIGIDTLVYLREARVSSLFLTLFAEARACLLRTYGDLLCGEAEPK
jgi:hypothetical protein